MGMVEPFYAETLLADQIVRGQEAEVTAQTARAITIELPEDLYVRLQQTARATHQSLESTVLRALQNGSFALINLLDERAERQGWSSLSDAALQRVWDNETDSVYDES